MQASLDKILNSEYVMIGLAGLAFLIALWLVIVIVRMLTGGRLRFSSARTRQARLGIVDAFDLDRQRQLIIVRRDNTEHLIMIGGPNDLVIESEIVRVEAREGRRPAEKLEGVVENRIPAPVMMPDGASTGTDEPMLPLPSPASAPAVERPAAERPILPFPGPPTAGSEPLPPRTPTFPLPRRQPPVPPIERRPPPPPESVSRIDAPTASMAPSGPTEPPLQSRASRLEPVAPEPAPAPETSFPPPSPIPPQPLPPIVPTQGADVAPRTAVRPPPPSFLKPLPPRPPIRPLRRATPVAPAVQTTGTPTAGTSDDTASAPPTEVRPAAEPAAAPMATPTPAAAPPAAETSPAPAPSPSTPEPKPTTPAEPKAGQADALESLEEEMAKLLGRG